MILAVSLEDAGIGALITAVLGGLIVAFTKIKSANTKESTTFSNQTLKEFQKASEERDTQYQYLLSLVRELQAKQEKTNEALIHCKEQEGATNAKLTGANERIKQLDEQVKDLTSKIERYLIKPAHPDILTSGPSAIIADADSKKGK